MPHRERDVYMSVRAGCQTCGALCYCLVMALRRPTTLCLPCPNCKGDIVAALIPDESMDGLRHYKGIWIVPLADLIYLKTGLAEEEGDRLLWGNENVFESAINQFLKGESV